MADQPITRDFVEGYTGPGGYMIRQGSFLYFYSESGELVGQENYFDLFTDAAQRRAIQQAFAQGNQYFLGQIPPPPPSG